ncbi:NAD-dependent epimerase/dehydratase family protein [Thalassobacillus sp. B23F22_16]|uniref:NAD-dependent epimerase/dehydratase family protein n=1 Tax=Thalassobacillus sp. B23F22_16 TaxID=3459513 RepID=UPI00373DEE74
MGQVLVTGCNGFIGSRVTNALLNKGYKVLGLSTGEKPKILHEHFKYIRTDLTDCIAVENIFSNYDISTVIHLAAIAHLKGRKKIEWNEFYRVNTLASKTIFQCAIRKGASIFFASSVDVYGNIDDSIIKEDCLPNPISAYAKSKYFAEKTLEDLGEKYSHNYVIGRFAPVYDREFMKDAYKRIYLKSPDIAFTLGGRYSYHFVSVNNVVEFVVEWLNSKKNISGIFNVCDKEPINPKEFISLEKKLGNSKRVIHLPDLAMTFIKNSIEISIKLFKNQKLNKFRTNLYKLIRPARYSTNRMEQVMTPRWNLKNTVYREIQ